ncbi:MAG: hypothetical protein HY863_12585 [Chloroflexi bacterium]|nr:hypothetical protein [Chloroflexota bacterium]
MNEPKVYQHKPFQLILLIILFIFLTVFSFFNIEAGEAYILIPFGVFLGIMFFFSLYSMTVKTIISDTEISTYSILGTKSLSWGEISRVSGKGSAIKLHNMDGDITVAPSPQLPGYDEVIEWIGAKRPDLFDHLAYSEMKKGWFILFPAVLIVVIFIAGLLGSGLMFFNSSETPLTVIMPLIFITVIALAFFGAILSSPQSVTLDGKSMLVKYFFSEKTLLVDEIASVELRFTQTRNGKNYFVQLNLTHKKSLRISGMNIGLPIAYLVLKNWQKKYSGIGLTNQNNFFN